jgi:hypothetical protein
MQETGAANRPCWHDAAQMWRKSRFQSTQSIFLIEWTENLLRTAIALVSDLYVEVFCKSLILILKMVGRYKPDESRDSRPVA